MQRFVEFFGAFITTFFGGGFMLFFDEEDFVTKFFVSIIFINLPTTVRMEAFKMLGGNNAAVVVLVGCCCAASKIIAALCLSFKYPYFCLHS